MFGIDLKEHEDIIDIVYQSMLVYVRSLFVAITCLTATSYALFWLLEQGVWGQVVVVLGYSIGALLILRMIIFWRGTKLLITTQRVFDIYQASLFRRDITQIRMRDVDDVSGAIKGFWGTLLRLGEVRIASKRSEIAVRMPYVRRPVYIQDVILDRVEAMELGTTLESLGDKEVLAYMNAQSVSELDALIRKAMVILRKKKET